MSNTKYANRRINRICIMKGDAMVFVFYFVAKFLESLASYFILILTLRSDCIHFYVVIIYFIISYLSIFIYHNKNIKKLRFSQNNYDKNILWIGSNTTQYKKTPPCKVSFHKVAFFGLLSINLSYIYI